MNATLRKFGYPDTLVAEYLHWCVLLRPQQVTLGALVLAAKSEVESFSALPAQAFAELAQVTQEIEQGLGRFEPYQKINYLMLMMVDKHVHMHVVPRYDGARQFNGIAFKDAGWPALPDLKLSTELTPSERSGLLASVRDAFKQSC